MTRNTEAVDVPDVVILQRHGRGVQLKWRTGELVEIGASSLRARCRCSICLHRSQQGKPSPPESDTAIVELRQVGLMGLQAVFSDGHERGIYPWSYLSEIGRAA